MPIVGINLKSIKANIDESKLRNNVNINSVPKIENVSKIDAKDTGFKDIVAIDFTFTTKYETDVGEIAFTGVALYHTDDPKEVVTKWKKDKKFDDNITIEVLNAIFRKCLTKAIDIAAELRLPPPIAFPLVKKDDKSK